MKEPTCKMSQEDRRQLYDEIQDGTVSLRDLSMAQLKDFRCDFDLDYNPTEEFFRLVGNEVYRRSEVNRKCKKVVRDFFG